MSETYGLAQTTAPTAQPLEADEFIRAYGIPEPDETAHIKGLIATATKLLEDFTGLQFVTATYKLYLDCFPDWEIQLHKGPWSSTSISSGGSIAYTDTAGASQTVATSDYRFDDVQGRLTPAYGESWPSTRDITNAVIITYTSGFGGPTSVPEDIKSMIRAAVLDWFENRRLTFELPPMVRELARARWDGRM